MEGRRNSVLGGQTTQNTLKIHYELPSYTTNYSFCPAFNAFGLRDQVPDRRGAAPGDPPHERLLAERYGARDGLSQPGEDVLPRAEGLQE